MGSCKGFLQGVPFSSTGSPKYREQGIRSSGDFWASTSLNPYTPSRRFHEGFVIFGVLGLPVVSIVVPFGGYLLGSFI